MFSRLSRDWERQTSLNFHRLWKCVNFLTILLSWQVFRRWVAQNISRVKIPTRFISCSESQWKVTRESSLRATNILIRYNFNSFYHIVRSWVKDNAWLIVKNSLSWSKRRSFIHFSFFNWIANFFFHWSNLFILFWCIENEKTTHRMVLIKLKNSSVDFDDETQIAFSVSEFSITTALFDYILHENEGKFPVIEVERHLLQSLRDQSILDPDKYASWSRSPKRIIVRTRRKQSWFRLQEGNN